MYIIIKQAHQSSFFRLYVHFFEWNEIANKSLCHDYASFYAFYRHTLLFHLGHERQLRRKEQLSRSEAT